jgi:hypothetical protein
MSNKPKANHPSYTEYTFSSKTGCNTVYVICLEKDTKPFKVFISMGKGGGCARSVSCTFSDLINAILDKGGSPIYASLAIKGHDCHKRNCCSNKIADILQEWGEMYENPK